MSHTGVAMSQGPDSADLLWSKPLGGTIYSSPAIVNDRVYVGCSDGNVYCFNVNSGSQLWSHRVGSAVESSPAVEGDNLFIGANGRNLYCLASLTGAERWNHTTYGGVTASAIIHDDVVYFSDTNGDVYALSTTGAFIWKQGFLGASMTSSPAYRDGYIYVGGGNYNGEGTNYLYCLNASTGQEQWSYPAGDAVSSSPTVINDRIYFGSDDTNVYCLDSSGGLVWQYYTGPASYFYSSPAVCGNYLVVGCVNNKCICLDAAGGGGTTTQTWSKPQSSSYGFSSSAAIAGDKVYIGDSSGYLWCLNLTTGGVIWSYYIGISNYGVTSSPAVASGKVVVGGGNGNLYCFGPDTTPLKVVGMSPSNGATGVPWSTDIEITFDNDALVTSISTSTFTVEDDAQQLVGGTVSYQASSRKATFVPDDDLAGGTTYAVRLSGGILGHNYIGLDGNGDGVSEGSPLDDFTFQFSTQMIYGPSLGTIGPLQCVEDVPYQLDLASKVSDQDTPTSELIIEENSGYASVSGHVVSFTYPEGVLGETVNISVTDGVSWAWEHVMVTVSPINDAPLLLAPPSAVEVTEDQERVVQLEASDLDMANGIYKDDLEFHIEVSPAPSSNDVFSVNTHRRVDVSSPVTYGNITIRPTNEDVLVGAFIVNVEVIDSGTPSKNDTFKGMSVVVNNVNDPPVLGDPGIQLCKEDLWHNMTIEAFDPDPDDKLEYCASIVGERSALPLNFKLDDETGELHFLPTNDDVGVWSIEFGVSDGDGETDSIEVTFSVDNVNDPPGVPTIYYDIVDADPSTPDVKENLSVRFFTNEVFDIDDDELVYSWNLDSTSGVHISAEGLVILITFPVPGNYTATLTVSDSHPGGIQQVSKMVEVIEPPTGRAGDNGKTSSDGSPSVDEEEGELDDDDTEGTTDNTLSIIVTLIAVMLIGVLASLGIYLKRIRGTPARGPPDPYDTPRSDAYHGRRPHSRDPRDHFDYQDEYSRWDDPWEDEEFEVF